MKLTNYFLNTLKEKPADTQIISHQLMLRSGLIRPVSTGLFTYLPLGMRILHKIMNIIHKEMQAKGALELGLSMLVPQEFLIKSKRDITFGNSILHLQDRHGRKYVLGPTHEENVSELMAQEIQSYKNLPLNVYQIQTKFRDELRPRFGVIRTKEFLMKDGYSFHRCQESLDTTYEQMKKAYQNIFRQCGLKITIVKASSGTMGGNDSEEFMIQNGDGEETIVQCDACGYLSNQEAAECWIQKNPSVLKKIQKEIQKEIQLVETPFLKTVDSVSKYFNLAKNQCIKTLIYTQNNSDELFMVLIQGDLEVNETKLAKILKVPFVSLAKDKAIEEKLKLPVGFLGPVNLKAKIAILADFSILNTINGFTGANIKNKHYKNVNIERDFKPSMLCDLQRVQKGQNCIHCQAPLRISKAIELGHIFKLGQKYTKAHQVTYLDEKGKKQYPTMGCYGIGINRIIPAVLEQEQNHDEDGIIWPISISPYQVILISIQLKKTDQQKKAQDIYEMLLEQKIEVLFDDRNLRAGIQFKDADLIGIPIRINISEKSLSESCVEVKLRHQKSIQWIHIDQLMEHLKKMIAQEQSRFV